MTCRFTKICVLLLCSVFALATFAQNTNSTIKGTVQDASGAVVSGATVDLTNVGTGQQLSTTSGQDGFYVFSNLSPANYKVTTTAPGFATWVGILTLRVSQAAQVNPSLVAASVSTQVTVRDVTPVIDKVNSTISDVKNATAIETLPVLGRNILSLLAFSPGVVANNYGGSGGGYTRVNGLPGGSMDYLVDGQSMATKWSNELVVNPQPTPTLQESKIITANGDAQYATPGVVELVTKSGTNHFHGQVYELNKNNMLQARTFNSGPSVPYLMHNEYGGQIGGPVWIPKVYNGKNKTFFFVDLEWIRENAFATNSSFTVLPAQFRQGDLSGFIGPDGQTPITFYDPSTTTYDPVSTGYVRQPFPGNKIPVNPVSAKILNLIPVPNISGAPYDVPGTPNYTDPQASITTRNKLYTAKVDQLFGPNRLAMRYTYTASNELKPPDYLLNPNSYVYDTNNGSLAFTEVISPKAINVVHAGVQYTNQFSGPVPISPSIPIQVGLPNYQNTISWPGITYDGYAGSLSSIDRHNPKAYPDQNATLSDQFTYNRGNHQFMAGFNVSNSRLTTQETGQPGGTYEFFGNFTAQQDLTQAAQGIYNTAIPSSGGNCDGFTSPYNQSGCAAIGSFMLGDSDGVIINVYPRYHTRQTQYAGFVQDDWRVTQNLTLNLGVRYTYWSPFDDASGLQSTLDLSVAGGEVVYKGPGPLPAQTPQPVLTAWTTAGLPIESAKAAGFPLSLWNMPKNNWDPRIGFAYQMGSKRVLRGGWGIYHWVMPLQQYQQATRKNPPFSFTQQIQVGSLPDGSINDYDAPALEFPLATANYGGPTSNLNYWMLGSSTLVLQPSNATINTGNFNMAPMDVNYKAPTAQEYNLTLEQELPGHIGFQLSYIGNHSYNLLQLDPINAALPQELCPSLGLPANCGFAQTHAFPLFKGSSSSAMDFYRYNGYANTNELQTQIQRNFDNGLTIQSYFTWQRTLTTTEDTYLGQSALEVVPAALTPGYNPNNYLSGASYSARQRVLYANDSNLPDKTFSVNGHYELPFGRGKKYLSGSHGFANALVSGYNLSAFFLWHSGLFFSPYFSSYGSPVILAPGKTGILPESQRTPQHWFDASIWNPSSGPYAGQAYEFKADPLGSQFRNNIPRNYMTGPGFNQMDATLYKLTPLGRGNVLDIEAQFFNVYNHQNLAMPSNFGVISKPLFQGSNNSQAMPRTIQLQAKYIF
jgi:hypothetical protein